MVVRSIEELRVLWQRKFGDVEGARGQSKIWNFSWKPYPSEACERLLKRSPNCRMSHEQNDESQSMNFSWWNSSWWTGQRGKVASRPGRYHYGSKAKWRCSYEDARTKTITERHRNERNSEWNWMRLPDGGHRAGQELIIRFTESQRFPSETGQTEDVWAPLLIGDAADTYLKCELKQIRWFGNPWKFTCDAWKAP